MMGAAGALCCLLAGTAAGSWLRDRRLRRLRTLRARQVEPLIEGKRDEIEAVCKKGVRMRSE